MDTGMRRLPAPAPCVSTVPRSSDRRVIRNPEFQLHPERCPASLPLYRLYASDWFDTGLVYLRASSAAALWFLKEVQVRVRNTRVSTCRCTAATSTW